MYKHLRTESRNRKTSSRFMIKSIAIFHGCVSHCKVWRREMKFLSRSRGDRARRMRDVRILEDFLYKNRCTRSIFVPCVPETTLNFARCALRRDEERKILFHV